MPLKPARDQYATYIDAYKRAEALGPALIRKITAIANAKLRDFTVEYAAIKI